MKNYILKNGIYSGLFLTAAGLLQFYALGGSSAGPDDYKTGEVIGYLTIVASMAFVFLGVKAYRDNENGGKLSFGEALKMGALIVIFPSLAFALYNWVYVEILDPGFIDRYYQYQLEDKLAAADPSEKDAVIAAMEGEKEMFSNVGLSSIVMFLTVYVIGFICSIVSGLVLGRK